MGVAKIPKIHKNTGHALEPVGTMISSNAATTGVNIFGTVHDIGLSPANLEPLVTRLEFGRAAAGGRLRRGCSDPTPFTVPSKE